MGEAEESGQVTLLLEAVGAGRPGAGDRLWEIVYPELQRLAHQEARHELPGRVQSTSLVHEAYVRLVGNGHVRWDNRRHFFAAAAQAMRRILVDRAREAGRKKRGGGRERVPLDEVDGVEIGSHHPDAEVLAIDGALDRLAELDPRKAEVVKFRYFAGLTVEQTANALGISKRTVNLEWEFARAWLHREIEAAARGGSPGGENEPGGDGSSSTQPASGRDAG